MICKNERENFPILLSSFAGCVDEICITDTGSTDGTVEYLTDLSKTGDDVRLYGAKVKLSFFDWIGDFGAARNESFKHATKDFVMWADLDDSLENPEIFVKWRDNSMGLCDYWLAPYKYAFDENGVNVCTFLRERVIRRNLNPQWDYFVHEEI